MGHKSQSSEILVRGGSTWLRSRRCWVYVFCLYLGFSFIEPSERCWAQVSQASYAFTGGAAPFHQISFLRNFPGTGLRAGPVILHPFLGGAVIYSDNIFRIDKRRRSDFIYNISPGLQAILPFGGRHQLMADYRASQQYFQRFSENNALSQEVMGQLNLDFPVGLKVKLKGGHIEGFDQRGSEFDLQQRDLTTWNTDSFVGQVEKLGSQIGFRFRFFFTKWNYENNNQAPIRDLRSTGADATFFVPVSPKIAPLLSFEINDNDFEENNQLDSFSYTISTGVRLAATSRLSGEFRAGYQVLNFDHAPITQPAGSRFSDGGQGNDIFFMQGNLNWNPTSRFKMNLGAFRGNRQSGVFSSSVITQTGVSLLATQQMGKRAALRGGMRFVNNKFNDQSNSGLRSDRRDNQITSRLGLDYRTVKWLGFRLEYIFQRRFSNVNQFDFYANSIMVSLQGAL